MNLNLNSRDRQEEIIRILRSSKQTTVSRLSAEFGVSVSTIYRDITALSHKFPITTQQGNGGGVFLVDSYGHPHREILSGEENAVLCNIIKNANPHEAEVIRRIVETYGNSKFLEDAQ